MVILLIPVFAVHAAPPVTTNSERAVAGTTGATRPQAAADQHKAPAAIMPGVTAVVGPGSSGKPAWEWSDEERIRVRFDPASIRDRAVAHEAMLPPYAHAQVQSAEAPQSSQHLQAHSAQAPRASQLILDGARDPGLFLPSELLDVLLEGLHPKATFRMHARDALAKDIRAMGYTEDDFWNKLEQLSAPYRALTSRPKNLAVQHVKTPDGKMASFLIDVDQCVARDKLLQSARMTFGAEAFQRFLYASVAPEIWRSDATNLPNPGQKQQLLFVARGCVQRNVGYSWPAAPLDRPFTPPQSFHNVTAMTCLAQQSGGSDA
jgi:hypothetical protein